MSLRARWRTDIEHAQALEYAAEDRKWAEHDRKAALRVKNPVIWTLNDILNHLYFETAEELQRGLFGDNADRRFRKVVAKVQKAAHAGQEISESDADKLLAWAWPFVMHEEQMVLLGQQMNQGGQA